MSEPMPWSDPSSFGAEPNDSAETVSGRRLMRLLAGVGLVGLVAAVAWSPSDAKEAASQDLSDAPGYDSNRVVAQPLLGGSQSNVRIIRLSPGQALPPHRHGSSDLMLFAVEGEGVLQTDSGTVGFAAGSLAHYRGDEELRVSNEGRTGLTLLAFLAPPFPPRSET